MDLLFDEVEEKIRYSDYRKSILISAFADRTIYYYNLLYLIIFSDFILVHGAFLYYTNL